MFITFITFIVVLSILVFVHELGHFWTARKMGVRAEEFGIGFPPRAIGYYKSTDGKWRTVRGGKEVKDAADTIYSLNWFPLGGFVKLGEDDIESDNPDHFINKKIWQKMVIIMAGVTMNIVLAMFLISVGYMIGLPQALGGEDSHAIVTNKQIQIVEVIKDSPAEKAEIKIGDVILSINENKFDSFVALQEFVDSKTGEEIVYSLKRGEKEISKNVTPELREDTEKGGIGVAIAETGIVKYSFLYSIWNGISTTLYMTWAILLAFGGLLKGLIFGQGLSGDIAGPVGIAALTGQVARMGFVYLLQFTAILSVNLAIINALPFPALDGGRALFLIIEKVKGSPVKKEVEGLIHYIGFALLMLLIVVVTFKDVARYGDKFHAMWQAIKGIF